MKLARWPLRWPGRLLVPLFLLVFALAAIGIRFNQQMRTLDHEVTAQEMRRLLERMNLEQARLNARIDMGNPVMVRRLVGGLALHQGLNRAYLVGSDGQVEASLSRLDLGRPLAAVLADSGDPPAMLQALGLDLPLPAIEMARIGELPWLGARVPVQGGRRLLVLMDLSYPMAQRRAVAEAEVVREGVVVLAAAGLLAGLLHLLWFRRAQHLVRSLADMGSGKLTTRAHLSGGDELAQIGAAADRMASQLQTGQERVKRMADIINRSPLVVMEWRNAPGWPVSYVSESVAQWGYSPSDFLDSALHYSDLIHPDDASRVHAEVAAYLEQGPDAYQQDYRIRCADGRWVWVEDRTTLLRGADGEVLSISGILLDTTAQKAAEQAQREQAELLRMFYELPFLGMAISSPTDKRWLQVNDRLCNMLGYSREELLGMTWVEMTPPGDLERNLELFQKLEAGQHSGYQMAKRFVRKDGALVHAEIEVRAVRHADGRLKQLFATVQDVTERKAVEAELALERSRLAEAQAVARIGSWSLSLPGGEVSWSDQNYAVLGLDPAEVEPSVEAYLSAVHPDDRPRVQAHVGRDISRQKEAVFTMEHRVVTSQGVRFVEERSSVERDAQGNVIRLFGTTMDVTERREAELVLQDYKEMLEQAEALAQLGSWTGDVDSQHLTISDQLFRNVGLDPSQGMPTDEAYLARIHPEDRAMVLTDMQRIRAGLEVGELLIRTDPAWGPMRWLRRTVKRIPRESDTRGPRYIGTLLDITDAVEAEERLERLNAELEKRVIERTEALSMANQELEAFSYTVSHDLKAPLRGIDGYSQLLVEEYGDRLDEEGREFVGRIRQGVQQMGDLISDLLEYSRMERRDMTAAPVAVLPLVQQVLDGYESDVLSQGVQVRLDMAPFTLPLDREGMAVVLRNLIGNALKFSRGRHPPVVEIGTRSEGQRRVLWVRDNGTGFEPKYHDRMFKIFQRLHRSEDFPGTGVGLALVAKAVQRMGGRVWAESTPGEGATFFLEFPE
jgi:PAS domain S-box-containing protein